MPNFSSLSPIVALSRRRMNQLLKVARALRVSKVANASGRCLALSLELSWVARLQGLEVNLVVWHVVNDDCFFDHWAVLIGPSQVIDLTRVQVDGGTGVLHELDSYPANFISPRFYPAALLLVDYAEVRAANASRLPPSFIWKMHQHLLRQDLGRALSYKHYFYGFLSIVEFVKFSLVYSLDRWLGRFQARRDVLFGDAESLQQKKNLNNVLLTGCTLEMYQAAFSELSLFL